MATDPLLVPCWQTRKLLAWCIVSTALLVALLPSISAAESYGYDSASSCDPSRASRRGRSQLLKTIPCDLTLQAYCNLPGSAYPWHAVRRFVHENQGLMRRMYGDVRHISVLKEEFENNEIELDDIERATQRYSQPQAPAAADSRRRIEGGKRLKYLRPATPPLYESASHYLRDKSNEIALNEPHFRPAHLKTTSGPRTGSTSAASSSSSSVSTTTTPGPKTSAVSEPPTPSTTTSIPERPLTTQSSPTTTSSNTATATTVESPPRTIPSTTSTDTSTLFSRSTTKAPDTVVNGDKTQAKNVSSMVNSKKAENVSYTTEGDKLSAGASLSNNDRLLSVNDNITIQTTTEAETIDMEALSSLAKLETSDALLVELEKKDISGEEPLGGKISSTLKLSSSSSSLPNAGGGAAAAEEQSSNSYEPTESSATKRIESSINSYQDQQDSSDGDVDKVEAEPPTEAKHENVLPAVPEDTVVPSGSAIHQQKIRFESIKSGASVGIAAGPAKKPNAEGQLFQDATQKEPPVVNGRGVNACPVKEEVVAPFWANNTRGEVLALLNLYPFEQYVHWEKCTHELKQMYCREGCRCEQQYRLHRLLAYDPHNECRGIFSDWFRFPSCCICKCYDMPFDFRVTSRSPRSLTKESIELVEDELQNAIYEHATDEWYRPKEYDLD